MGPISELPGCILKAVLLILAGLSMQEVMENIGWKNESSLLRYIKTEDMSSILF